MASLFTTLRDAIQATEGHAEQEAHGIASRIIEWGIEHGHAGVEHYWPCRLRTMTKSERDEAIRREFDGTNLRVICEKYEVSQATVYAAKRANHYGSPLKP